MNIKDYKKELLDLGLLPTQEQELLLKAALLIGKDSISAWQKWKTRVDINFLDHASINLLPLLYYNLTEQGIKDPIINRYKGTFRKTWYKNQMLMSELKALVSVFQKAGIETMALKGIALILKYYPNYGLRPMADIDLMVPIDKIPEALLLLEEEGWKSKLHLLFETKGYTKFNRKKIDEQFFTVRASCGFENSLKREFDLHGHILNRNFNDRIDDKFWEAAQTFKISDELDTHLLSPTDTLFHVIMHGLQKGNITNIRWIADSYAIISKSKIDWENLRVTAEQHGLIIYLVYGISYLKELLNVSIPEYWFIELQNINLSPKECRFFRIENKSIYMYYWTNHSRLHINTNFFQKVILFPKYIKRFYLFNNYMQIPFYIIYIKFTRIINKIFHS